MFLKVSQTKRVKIDNINEFSIFKKDLKKLNEKALTTIQGARQKKWIERRISIQTYPGLKGKYFYLLEFTSGENDEYIQALTERIVSVYMISIEVNGRKFELEQVYKNLKTANQFLDRLEIRLQKN
ncbi:MAG TPA: hypothetical protein DHW82_09640 [Spirochaetia bacterium]|nr:MAG: hypothetical protein A2Y41_00515 [Spirochaetes bacterium GWB1_36_13]HCL57253.1 hypothetical protein [Spirochaetia bacterium]